MKELLFKLADRVQEAVKGFHGGYGEKVGIGAYGAPTSAIDKVAEDVVLKELERSSENLNVLSEEIGFLDKGGELTLVLDPVDGTHNAMRGLPVYSTSMAIGRDSMEGTLHGLVRDLVSGKTYYASKGDGALLDDGPIKVRQFNPKDVLFSIYMCKNSHDDAFKVARNVRRVRNLGAASIDMCIVASGAADAYYMNSIAKNAELRVVDIAASALILREAGGDVVDLNRQRLNMPYDAKTRTNLIAYGDKKVLDLIP